MATATPIRGYLPSGRSVIPITTAVETPGHGRTPPIWGICERPKSCYRLNSPVAGASPVASGRAFSCPAAAQNGVFGGPATRRTPITSVGVNGRQPVSAGVSWRPSDQSSGSIVVRRRLRVARAVPGVPALAVTVLGARGGHGQREDHGERGHARERDPAQPGRPDPVLIDPALINPFPIVRRGLRRHGNPPAFDVCGPAEHIPPAANAPATPPEPQPNPPDG